MRSLLVIAIVLGMVPARTVATAQKAAVPFTRASFTRVIITETDYPNPEAALSGGWQLGARLPASFVTAPDDSNRATLGPAEADTLYRKLVSPKSYRQGAAICFVPRPDIFFLKGDTLVNHVAVCIECNRLQSAGTIKAAEWSKNTLNPKGMSASMRRYLSALIRRHGFEHGIDGRSVWDN